MRRCSNKDDCPYVNWGKNGTPLEAYDQDETRWREGRPTHNGLCLNCIADLEQDKERDQ